MAWRAVGHEELDRIIARAGAGDARSPAALSSQRGCGGPDRGYDRGAVDSYYLHYLIWFGVLMAVAGGVTH